MTCFVSIHIFCFFENCHFMLFHETGGLIYPVNNPRDKWLFYTTYAHVNPKPWFYTYILNNDNNCNSIMTNNNKMPVSYFLRSQKITIWYHSWKWIFYHLSVRITKTIVNTVYTRKRGGPIPDCIYTLDHTKKKQTA